MGRLPAHHAELVLGPAFGRTRGHGLSSLRLRFGVRRSKQATGLFRSLFANRSSPSPFRGGMNVLLSRP
jgi:hypothetical protein